MWIIMPNIQSQGRELEFCTAKILVRGWAAATRVVDRRDVWVMRDMGLDGLRTYLSIGIYIGDMSAPVSIGKIDCIFLS